MLIKWTQTETTDGRMHTSENIDGYVIVEGAGKEGYFVRRTVAECDDIGPLPSFKDAEDVVMKIGISLIGYEELLWKVMAAQAMKVTAPLLDGTASLVEDTAP